jgi:hypothetical protein
MAEPKILKFLLQICFCVLFCFLLTYLTNGWIKLPKMNHKRSHHSLVNLGGQLYALGGYTNIELDSVERLVIPNTEGGFTALARVYAS